MVVETILMALIMILVQLAFWGTNSGIVGVNPFISIISNAWFIFLMRFLLGFCLFNSLLWLVLSALPEVKIPLAVVCVLNVLSILAMYLVWNQTYDIFRSLSYVKSLEDLFGVYQVALLCAAVSPIIVRKMAFLPNSLSLILKESKPLK